MTSPTMRPLSFGEILDGALTLYRRNFARLVGTAAVVAAVTVVTGLFLAGVGSLAASVLHPALGAALLAPIVGALVTLGWSSLTWQAARLYQGKPAPLGDSLAVALIGAMPLVGSCLIVWAALGIAGAAGSMGLIALELVLDPGHLLVSPAAWTAVFALICLWVAALFFAVVPAVVLEGQGPLEAVERSAELARGAQPRIAGALAVASVIGVAPSLALFWLTDVAPRLTDPQATMALTPGGFIAERLLSLAVYILTAPVLPSVIVLLYHDRRVRTEPLAMEIAARRHIAAGA